MSVDPEEDIVVFENLSIWALRLVGQKVLLKHFIHTTKQGSRESCSAQAGFAAFVKECNLSVVSPLMKPNNLITLNNGNRLVLSDRRWT